MFEHPKTLVAIVLVFVAVFYMYGNRYLMKVNSELKDVRLEGIRLTSEMLVSVLCFMVVILLIG